MFLAKGEPNDREWHLEKRSAKKQVKLSGIMISPT
jgi:hypothetical protein